MNKIINIGIPSKGRLKKGVLEIFKNKKLKLISLRGTRDLFASIKKLPKVKIIYLHAREIIERLADGSLDIGFSGYDLLKESQINIQKKISVLKKYNFGHLRPPGLQQGLNPGGKNLSRIWLPTRKLR